MEKEVAVAIASCENNGRLGKICIIEITNSESLYPFMSHFYGKTNTDKIFIIRSPEKK